MSGSNGASPKLDGIVTALESELATVERELEALEKGRAQLIDERRKLKSALAALGSPRPARAESKPPAKRSSRVSPDTIAAVEQALRKLGRPASRVEISQAAGVGPERVTFALMALRDRQVVRKAGKAVVATGRAPGLWALMEEVN